MEQVYLSRRNLLTLLNKLDRKARGEETKCTIVKNDNAHISYPQTMEHIMVTAVEDEEYYAARPAGAMHASDDPALANPDEPVVGRWPWPVY